MYGPDLRYGDVKQAAVEFLKRYHPTNRLPVPIEDIVEYQIHIALFAVPGIKLLLGIDAFISSDFDQITLDADCFVKYPERTRFSIAHEIGHLVLHRGWYEKHGPKSIEDYFTSHDRMDDQIYNHIEIQAQTFAGLVLVPQDLLLDELRKRLGRIPSSEPPEVLSPFVQDLPALFQVSDAVILRRLQREGLVKQNDR